MNKEEITNLIKEEGVTAVSFMALVTVCDMEEDAGELSACAYAFALTLFQTNKLAAAAVLKGIREAARKYAESM